jgi:hypothetical protein
MAEKRFDENAFGKVNAQLRFHQHAREIQAAYGCFRAKE